MPSAAGCGRVTDGSRCYLAVEEQQRRRAASCERSPRSSPSTSSSATAAPDPAPSRIPKLVDLADGDATYDERLWRKRPDWTYA